MKRIAVAVSGAGSNLRALHAGATRGDLGATISLVVADRACPALDWAAEQGLDTALIPGGDDVTLAATLLADMPDLVVPRSGVAAAMAALPEAVEIGLVAPVPELGGARYVERSLA